VQGVSRTSLAERRDELASRAGADGGMDQDALLRLSDELYAVTSLLASSYGLRRGLSDPSLESDARQRIVDSLLSGKVDETTVQAVRGVAGSPWSQPRDLVDAVETLAADAALIAAENAGQLDEVEDELFRFERIMAAEPQLRSALSDLALPAERKRALLERLLADKATPVTIRLLERSVTEPRGRTIERAIADVSTLAAGRRERLIARVTSAVALTDEERGRLADALAETFGQQLHLQLIVDESLIGGLSVRVGDEVIDASVSRQLDEARRRLTGGGGRARRT
jgi:F-type H+-transporting ATPase subunit delta